MPKQIYTMRNFSGGINNDKDARDIQENEFVHIEGFMTDQNGALRPAMTSISHNGLISNKSIGGSVITGVLAGSGGYNLGYFETDSDLSTSVTVTGAIKFNDGGIHSSKDSGATSQEETTTPV